jgi:ParB/RepB/Spo0J family partition protein
MSESAAATITDTAPTTLKRVRLLDIRENKTALRECNRDTVEYKELLASVKENGVFQTITVRECVDEASQQTYYGLVDGLQRFTAAKDAGLDALDVKVIKADDFNVLKTQLILNVQRIETKPAEYSKQLSRMLNMNPTLTMNELAGMLGKSTTFIYERLSLLKLDNKIAKLVDEGKINLPNAYALAKLPPEEQPAFVDRAMTQPPQEFIPQTTIRVKELKEAARKGQAAAPAEFVAQPRQRKLAELKEEYANPTVVKELVQKTGAKTAEDGFMLGVKWALHMDPISVAQDKAKDEARKKEAEEAKIRREIEKEEKKKSQVVASALGVKE